MGAKVETDKKKEDAEATKEPTEKGKASEDPKVDKAAKEAKPEKEKKSKKNGKAEEQKEIPASAPAGSQKALPPVIVSLIFEEDHGVKTFEMRAGDAVRIG